MKTLTKAALGAGMCLMAAGAAQSAPIDIGVWYTAAFGDTPGTPLTTPPFSTTINPDGQAAPEAPWTFTLNTRGTLTVVDLQISGDEFEFFDFGTSLGVTSPAVDNVSSVGNDVTAALADSNFSRAIYNLRSGDHSITGTYLGSINNGDVAFIVNQVPVPASALLLGTALLGAGAGLRRRKAS